MKNSKLIRTFSAFALTATLVIGLSTGSRTSILAQQAGSNKDTLTPTFWQRDPLSPPFHIHLQWGLRFLQASLLLPLHRKHQVHARAVPIDSSPL